MRTARRLAVTALLAAWTGHVPPIAAAAEPPPLRGGTDGPGREVDLRPRFETGRETRYQLDLTSANELRSDSTPEISGDQTLTQSIRLRLRTIEAGAEGATVELVYDSIKATLETADFRAEFDSAAGPAKSPSSAKPAGSVPTTTGRPQRGSPGNTGRATPDPEMNELLAQLMRPMVGTKLTMKVDAAGNITSVSGGESLAGAGLSGLLGDALKGLGGGGLGALPGGGGMSASPMNWMISGPGQRGTVRIGESWTNNDTLTGTPIGGLSMVTKHTCRSVSGGLANCSFQGQADGASQGHGAGTGLTGLGFRLRESSYGGTYTWDTERGELAELTSSINCRVDQGGNEENGSNRLTAKTRVNVRRLR